MVPSEYVPTEHEEHPFDPVADVNDPTAHAKHEDSPDATAYLPEAQLVQKVALDAAYVPTPQLEHTAEPLTDE